MRLDLTRLVGALLCLFLVVSLHVVRLHAEEKALSPLPAPVSNNAVAIAYASDVGTKIFSFMGIGAKKTWDDTTNAAYELDLKTGKWTGKRPVPGTAGRLGASAVALGGQVFIFGGYVIDGQGQETTLGDLNVYVPFEDRYYRGNDIPVPVDDAVAGVYFDRYIFLIGGRSKNEAVRNIQIYDTDKNVWIQGTPLPGTAVFGHAGGIQGDTIVYVDGAYKNPESKGPKYLSSSECWMGKLENPKKGGDIRKIEWTKIPAHPGNAHYRIAAGTGPPQKKGGKIFFSSGTENPYDYAGIGYNGQPAKPSKMTFAFDTRSGNWETISDDVPDPTMDHRGLMVTNRGLLMVGGMGKGQQVIAKVMVVKAGSKK